MPKRPFVEDELNYIRRNHKKKLYKEIAEYLGRPKSSVSAVIARLKLRKKKGTWAPWELEYLAENYGRKSAEAIARHLGRSTNALKICCFRHLHINQKSNIYAARAVQEVLGLSCAKIVVSWKDAGFLKGKRAPFVNGANQVWWFEYEDILKALQLRPWLMDRKRMPPSVFRQVVETEWEKNPWFTSKVAAVYIGLSVKTNWALGQYVKKGWLKGLRQHGAGGLGQWVFMRSDLDDFMLHDPRPQHRKGARLPLTLEQAMQRAQKSAWRWLAKGRLEMFGHQASIWMRLNSMNHRGPNIFSEVIEMGKIKKQKEVNHG